MWARVFCVCLYDGGECYLATLVYRMEQLRSRFHCRMYAEGVRKVVLSVVVPFHLPATMTQTHSTHNKTPYQQSKNTISCTQTLAITGTNSPVLIDQRYSTSFSAGYAAFLRSWSPFCLLHLPPFMFAVLAFYFHLLLSICNSWITVLFPLCCFVSVCGLRSLNLQLYIPPVQKTPVVTVCTAALL